jgi:hypothetical protein
MTKETLETYTDKCGVTTRVGDFILYGQTHGRMAAMTFGRVLSIELRDGLHHDIRVLGTSDLHPSRSPRLNTLASVLRYPDHTVNANLIVPQEIKSLYETVTVHTEVSYDAN